MIDAKQIDWSLVPESAEYVAMDADGQAWAYEKEPTISSGIQWHGMDAEQILSLNDYIDRSQWRSSLARRPNDDQLAMSIKPHKGQDFYELPIGDDLSDMAPKNWPGDKYQQTINTHQSDSCDNVTRPSHYVIKDGVEVIDVREWWLQCIADYQIEPMRMHDPDVIDGLETISHLERAMEYLLRAPGKNGMEDIRKSYQYLHRALHGEWPK